MQKPILALTGLTVAPIIAVAPHAAAQKATTLEEVVVTATRAPQPRSESLAPTTVIDRQDIEQSGQRSLQGLLQQTVPGLQISNSGGAGKDTSVFLRGTNSDHVLVLINGVKQGSATLGTTSFQHLPLAQIERIEVVRGPRSSLYGSEAIGGVIQIFTRSGEPGMRANARAGYGSNDRYEASAGISGGTEATTYSLHLDRVDTEGIDAHEGGNPDEDGYDNTSVNLSLEHEPWQEGRASISFLRAEGTNEFDPLFGGANGTDFVQQSAQVRFEQTVNTYWDTTLQFGESRDETDNLLDDERQTFFDTRRIEATWQNRLFPTSNQEVVLGVDYRDDRVDSSTDFAEDSRYNRAVFGRWDWSRGPYRAQLGLRHDDNEAFGGQLTGDAVLGYRLNEGLRVTASYGTAFKAPTFNDLFFPDIGFFKGNPDLEEETSRSAELGLIGNAAWGSWEIRYFETRIDDLIQNETVGGVLQPRNVDQAEIRGVELAADVRVDGWRVRPSLTVQDPENEDTGNQLRRRAEQSFKLDALYAAPRWTLGGSLQLESERFDDAANQTRLAGYGVVNLRGEYRLAPQWKVRVEGNNVLDKDYQTADGFNRLGRTVFASVSYGGR
ncbi:TonB-dependent receptor domain-containing protein [Thiohalorhabdus sp.]|uniref:TonB-dependent receptor domain-containing protein n=1 Tax=Thiohalorhabdus sp. TaxID=3094134 RepID=UPI002FC353E8